MAIIAGNPQPLTRGLANNLYRLKVDTRANLLASTPSGPVWGFATDTLESFIYDGSGWYVFPLEAASENTTPDMGAYNSDGLGPSDRAGIYPANGDIPGVLTDYILNNVLFGGNARTDEGAFRCVDGEFQAYANGQWNTVVIGFVFREDDTGAYELEHQPIGFEFYYEVMSGNSNETGLNGLPLVQQYGASMGAYPAKVILDGGTF